MIHHPTSIITYDWPGGQIRTLRASLSLQDCNVSPWGPSGRNIRCAKWAQSVNGPTSSKAEYDPVGPGPSPPQRRRLSPPPAASPRVRAKAQPRPAEVRHVLSPARLATSFRALKPEDGLPSRDWFEITLLGHPIVGLARSQPELSAEDCCVGLFMSRILPPIRELDGLIRHWGWFYSWMIGSWEFWGKLLARD